MAIVVLVGRLVVPETFVRGDVAPGAAVTVRWDRVAATSRATPSLQVVPNGPFRLLSPIRQPVLEALRDLRAELVRFVPWMTYPRLAVAALQPPSAQATSWDFTMIDPIVVDVMTAMQGRSVTHAVAVVRFGRSEEAGTRNGRTS